MYVILVYDVGEKRVNKACKFCRRYLNWVQNSVFEGELSEGRMERLRAGLAKLMDRNEDAVLIYKLRSDDLMRREVMGVEKAPTSNIV